MTRPQTAFSERVAWVLVPSLLVLSLLVCCGALDDSAPLLSSRKQCKTLDQYLAPLDAHVAAGRMKQLGRIIREDLDRASLRAFVQLLLDSVGDLPPGTLETLATALNKQTAGDTIGPLLIAFLKPLPGDANAKPAKPPRKAELLAFSRVATTCLRADLFAMATALLRDERLKPALGELFKGAATLAPDIDKALQDAGFEGRNAIVGLLRAVAISIAAPGFEPKPLIEMLDGLAGGNTTIKALTALLAMAMLDETGETDAKRVAALSAFVGCFLAVDTEFVLPGYLYDVVADGALGAAFAVTPTTATAAADRLDATMAVLDVLSYLTAALATNEAARDALGRIGGLLLRPDLAVVAIPELVDLLDAQVLDGLPSLLADIATQPCMAEAPK